MPSHIPNDLRDQLITAFRQRLLETGEATPFLHQAKWWAAADGLELIDLEAEDGVPVRMSDGTIQKRAVLERPGGRARVLADLGAFKVGKSWGGGMFAAAFGAVPGARVQLVGSEYDMCSPEFEYILEFLLSDSGMNMPYESLQNRPKDGRMWLELKNGARFEAKSWERKDSMKGKEIDLYLYCEAYQLPGLEAYTMFSQNLRARNGYAVFATTPDRPWLKDLHEAAHSGDPRFAAWHCTCGVHSSENHFTFDQGAMDRDQRLMTREKFAIHYQGKLGDFVGRVFGYQRGERTFSAGSHPRLFTDAGSTRDHLVIPDGWDVVAGADTGTFMSLGLVAFSPEGDAFVIDEFPNYTYVAGQIERDEQSTIPSWSKIVTNRMDNLGVRHFAWADANSQFKSELRNYDIWLESNHTPLETRTEIAREYFQHERIWLAPWLKVLPFELENAAWPEEASISGKYARVKDRDHTLDWLEHILSKRPRGKWAEKKSIVGRWSDQFKRILRGDPHLGTQ